jgi:hypothetical protein
MMMSYDWERGYDYIGIPLWNSDSQLAKQIQLSWEGRIDFLLCVVSQLEALFIFNFALNNDVFE